MGYKKIDEKDIAYIKEIIGDKKRVLVKDEINEEYGHDELCGIKSLPDIVAVVKARMKYQKSWLTPMKTIYPSRRGARAPALSAPPCRRTRYSYRFKLHEQDYRA